jgi:hypothetical protein
VGYNYKPICCHVHDIGTKSTYSDFVWLQKTTMVDAGSILSFTATTGVEALKILNKWLDSEEIAHTWYGSDKDKFTGHTTMWKFFRGKVKAKPDIKHVFTIQKEDWQLVIKESLPVSHTWFRDRKDKKGECSWLPLFWACREHLGDDRVCPEAQKSFSSLGIVSTLPAARLDCWGLVVMAYSNGAWSQTTKASDGGFKTSLFAKNFVLELSQANINAPVQGHLEPREHPAEDCEPLEMDESRHLLDYGFSFSPQNVTVGWPVNGDTKEEPPPELVNGRWDKQLRHAVLDHFRASELEKKLRDEIIDYQKAWLDFLNKWTGSSVEKKFSGNDIAFSLSKLLMHHRQAEKPQALRTQHDMGLRLDEFMTENVNVSQAVHKSGQYPRKQGKVVECLCEVIDAQLWRIKLLYYDKVKLVDNWNRHDVLEMFGEYEKLLQDLATNIESSNHKDQEGANAIADAFESLINRHHVVMAIARLLRFAEHIDAKISTRNTGMYVLLA